MKFGAVIVAAGMSTRMKQFKQLMNVGSMTMAERVINNFLEAGITDIVMVTGYKSDELETRLKNYKVTFIRNDLYETTQMFDSAKLGLDFLKNCSDKVFFTPVDIPFFHAETVRLLMEAEGNLIFPSINMKKGHPILIGSPLIPTILAFTGEGGLKGALASCKEIPVYVNVTDEAILYDADTMEEFNTIKSNFSYN
ncbi:MAG: nucleotidyltransferase family protein [Treponema sp.]|nr:nucleotidyltransferase family protein [Treponema sp.]